MLTIPSFVQISTQQEKNPAMSPSHPVLINNKFKTSSVKTRLFSAIRASVCSSAPRGTADRLISTIDELLFAVRKRDIEPSQDTPARNSLAPAYPRERVCRLLKNGRTESEGGHGLCPEAELQNQQFVPSSYGKTPKCSSLLPSPRPASSVAPFTTEPDSGTQGNGFFDEPINLDFKLNSFEHKSTPQLNESLYGEVHTSFDTKLPQMDFSLRPCSPSLTPLNLSPLPFLPLAPRRNVRRNLSGDRNRGTRKEPVITRSISKKRSGTNNRQPSV